MDDSVFTILDQIYRDWTKYNRGRPWDWFQDAYQEFWVLVLEKPEKWRGKSLAYFGVSFRHHIQYKDRRSLQRKALTRQLTNTNPDGVYHDDQEALVDFFDDLDKIDPVDRIIVEETLRGQTLKQVAEAVCLTQKEVKIREKSISGAVASYK